MGCPYTFERLKTNFPDEERLAFFRKMGWDDLISDPSYDNTCAMRVSTCLIRCGMTFPSGQIKILKGPHKGKRVEIKWKNLEETLTSEWGKKTKIEPPTQETCKPYQGVILFETLPPDENGNRYPGHIDVLDGPSGRCLYSTYFGSEKIGIWPAKKEKLILPKEQEINKNSFRGYINGIDVQIIPDKEIRCKAFVNGHNDYIQIMTNQQALQTVLELASSQKIEVEVWFVDKEGKNYLTRIRILDRK